MLRALTLSIALLASAPALACAGGDCPDDCGKKSTAAVESPDVDAAQGTKVAIRVDGMKCGACSSKITAALLETDGVTAATVNHETGVADVVYDPEKTDADALVAVITGLNYKAEVKPSET